MRNTLTRKLILGTLCFAGITGLLISDEEKADNPEETSKERMVEEVKNSGKDFKAEYEARLKKLEKKLVDYEKNSKKVKELESKLVKYEARLKKLESVKIPQRTQIIVYDKWTDKNKDGLASANELNSKKNFKVNEKVNIGISTEEEGEKRIIVRNEYGRIIGQGEWDEDSGAIYLLKGNLEKGKYVAEGFVNKRSIGIKKFKVE